MPKTADETIISFDGAKLYMVTCFCVLCIMACCWDWNNHTPSASPRNALYNAIVTNPPVHHALLTVGIMLFGFMAIANIRKMMGKKHGVILNAEGITDDTNLFSVGFVPWEDILEFKLRRGRNSKWISVKVKNPNHYINRASFLKQAGLMCNHSVGITPVCITTAQLEVSSEELLALCNEYLEKHGSLLNESLHP